MEKILEPADPRRWRPLIYSLLAYFLPAFFLNLLAVMVFVWSHGEPIDQEQLTRWLGSPLLILLLVVLQLICLDRVRRAFNWSWTDVGFNRFTKRQWELLWQIPLYLATLHTLNQLLEGRLQGWLMRNGGIRVLGPADNSLLGLLQLLATILPLEITLRGFVQNFCRARWGALGAVLVPALTITLLVLLMVLQALPPGQRPPLVMVTGLLVPLIAINLLQERHRNLWVPALVSAVNGLINLALY